VSSPQEQEDYENIVDPDTVLPIGQNVSESTPNVLQSKAKSPANGSSINISNEVCCSVVVVSFSRQRSSRPTHLGRVRRFARRIH